MSKGILIAEYILIMLGYITGSISNIMLAWYTPAAIVVELLPAANDSVKLVCEDKDALLMGRSLRRPNNPSLMSISVGYGRL